MQVYKSTFKVKQSKSIAFEYFLSKNNLKRFFQSSEEEIIEILSRTDNPVLTEGEEFDVVIRDEEIILKFRYTVLEIIRDESIRMRFQFNEIIDLEEEDQEDEIDANNFLSKYIGMNFYYSIDLQQKNDWLEIIEFSKIDSTNFLAKVFFKFYGFYFKMSRKKMYKRIAEEIEGMNDSWV